MAWTRWALVPKGVVGKTHHYWGMPAEVAPDAQRIDMPQARVLLIEEFDDPDDDDDVLREQKERVHQMFEELVKDMEARGTEVIRQESESEDVGLYRFAEDGEFAGDTLHDNFDAATQQANWEYDQVLEWHEVPPSLKDATVDRKLIDKLLKSLPN